MKKNKPKSHGKPTIKKVDYQSTMDTLGIESTDLHRPKDVIVYRIFCQHRKIMDQSKHFWSHKQKYAEDEYDSFNTALEVVNKLQKKYPNWFFSYNSQFIPQPDVKIIKTSTLPKDILIDLNTEEKKILAQLKIESIDRFKAHKQKIMGDAIEEAPKKKTTRKTKNK